MSECPVFNKKVTRHTEKQKTMVHSQWKKKIDRNHLRGRPDGVLQDIDSESIISNVLQELKETREQCLYKHGVSIKRQAVKETTKKF